MYPQIPDITELLRERDPYKEEAELRRFTNQQVKDFANLAQHYQTAPDDVAIKYLQGQKVSPESKESMEKYFGGRYVGKTVRSYSGPKYANIGGRTVRRGAQYKGTAEWQPADQDVSPGQKVVKKRPAKRATTKKKATSKLNAQQYLAIRTALLKSGAKNVEVDDIIRGMRTRGMKAVPPELQGALSPMLGTKTGSRAQDEALAQMRGDQRDGTGKVARPGKKHREEQRSQLMYGTDKSPRGTTKKPAPQPKLTEEEARLLMHKYYQGGLDRRHLTPEQQKAIGRDVLYPQQPTMDYNLQRGDKGNFLRNWQASGGNMASLSEAQRGLARSEGLEAPDLTTRPLFHPDGKPYNAESLAQLMDKDFSSKDPMGRHSDPYSALYRNLDQYGISDPESLRASVAKGQGRDMALREAKIKASIAMTSQDPIALKIRGMVQSHSDSPKEFEKNMVFFYQYAMLGGDVDELMATGKVDQDLVNLMNQKDAPEKNRVDKYMGRFLRYTNPRERHEELSRTKDVPISP